MMKLYFFITVSFLLSLYFLGKTEKPTLVLSRQNVAKNYNNNFLSFVSLGNKRMIADWFFVQTLMESDHDHYRGNDKNDWMYLRFNSILELDPRFLQAYQYGGQYLSIIKDDDQGAKDVYDRGLKIYPDDYFLNINAGFHYLYELNDLVRGKELYKKIMFHPKAPKFLPSIVARIDAEAGQEEAALNLLIENYRLNLQNGQEEFSRNILDTIESLQVHIDLQCLNQKKLGCRTKSFRGIVYKKNSKGEYTYPYELKAFKFNKKKQAI